MSSKTYEELEKEVYDIIGSHGQAIQYIKNPPEKLQLVAVVKCPYALYDIENPSEAVQLAAGVNEYE